MRDIIQKIVDGEDSLFEDMIKNLVQGVVLAFAQTEDPEGLTINFLNYELEEDEDIEYIPLFTDAEEVNAFVEEADVPDGYILYEFDGDLLADILDSEQYMMVNPVSGGIVFQGAHLKMFSSPANDDV
jgi:hypothetical protein